MIESITYQEMREKTGEFLVVCSKIDCAPCQQMKPVYKELAKLANLELFSADVSLEPDVVDAFNLRSVPVLLMIKDGFEVCRAQGMASIDHLSQLISDNKSI